ncbi:MAG TPA: hypothetical protein VFI24_27180 [Pyrinomonadaceae bacterium]|nr:hypothetical protein [Pyrinomonadaceae bacterium]
MKSRNLPMLSGLLMIGILITAPNLNKSITIEAAEILDNSRIAIAIINQAIIPGDDLAARIIDIAA